MTTLPGAANGDTVRIPVPRKLLPYVVTALLSLLGGGTGGALLGGRASAGDDALTASLKDRLLKLEVEVVSLKSVVEKLDGKFDRVLERKP